MENPLRTCPIQMGREMSIESYLNRQFGYIDDPDHHYSDVWVPTRTQTQSDGPEPLLTPPMQCHSARQRTDDLPIAQLWHPLACWITPVSVTGHGLAKVAIEENSNHESRMINTDTYSFSDDWYDFDHDTPELKGSMQNNDNQTALSRITLNEMEISPQIMIDFIFHYKTTWLEWYGCATSNLMDKFKIS